MVSRNKTHKNVKLFAVTVYSLLSSSPPPLPVRPTTLLFRKGPTHKYFYDYLPRPLSLRPTLPRLHDVPETGGHLGVGNDSRRRGLEVTPDVVMFLDFFWYTEVNVKSQITRGLHTVRDLIDES